MADPNVNGSGAMDAEMNAENPSHGADAATLPMDAFSAAMIADGAWELTPYRESEANFLAAYQYLVDTGAAWTLQGRIGRQAADLIEAGWIKAKEGAQ